MIKKQLLLWVALLFACSSFSQNILWEEDFADGIPSGWNQGVLISGSDAAWTVCYNQGEDATDTCPKIWDDDQNDQSAFAATSASNGFLTFDSDEHWINNPTQNHDLFIQTDPISIEGAEEVWIKFEYQIGVYINETVNNAFIEVIAGSGLKRYQIKPVGLGDNPYPEFIRWSRNPEVFFINATAFAQGESNIKLKWRWAGYGEYFWAIDDVVIYDKSPLELWLPDNDLEATQFVSVNPNTKTPASQTETFGFFGDFINRSATQKKDINFSGKIIYDGETVFEDSVIVDSIAPNSIMQNVLFPNEIPAFNDPGFYIGEYTVNNEDDETPANNKFLFGFEVTDEVFAKDAGISAYARPPDFRWEPNDPHNWAWGNVFYVPHGEGFKATGISFTFRKDSSFNYQDLEGVALQVQLYEWNDGPLQGNPPDGICQSTERTLIGVGDYKVTGDETPFNFVYQPFFDDESLNLRDNKHYIALVKFSSQVGAFDIELGAYVGTRYGSTLLRSEIVENRRHLSALWISEDSGSDFDMLGFGYDITPTVRLHIDQISSVDQPIANQDLIRILPNPTSDFFQIKNEGVIIGRTNELNLKIFSSDGKLVQVSPWGDQVVQSELINIGQLPPGIYNVVVGDAQQDYVTKRLVVQ